MGAIFNVFPLILIPVLTYNIWAFSASMGNADSAVVGAQILAALENHESPIWDITMASGAHWILTTGDSFILMSIILLFIELLKSTSTGSAAIFNHALSMLVFIICLVEFLLHPAFATSVFFIIMIMALLDVLAGVVVTIISARRDVEFAGQG
ncbi:MAG: hypothetical protein H7124_12825 [Phycisphaerales bacterium]|nr:hypothetical protein [Hyphomonadaceae bacterium]